MKTTITQLEVHDEGDLFAKLFLVDDGVIKVELEPGLCFTQLSWKDFALEVSSAMDMMLGE